MAINISEFLPCADQTPKRSGILFDIPNLTFELPAPCDCYDDIVVPVGSIVKMANSLRQTILQGFPKLFRFFRSGKLKEAIQINDIARLTHQVKRARYLEELTFATQQRQLKGSAMITTLTNLKLCIAMTPPGQVELCGGQEILHKLAAEAYLLAAKQEDLWLAKVAEIDSKIALRQKNIQ